jgi:hypothetical protein
MVSRKISVAVIVFGIAFASAIAGAREGREKERDDKSDNSDKRDNSTDDARISQGFEIAPVALHFKKKDRDLVGLGSYIVNAQGGCNDCHTNPPFATGGDPFLGQPKVINSTNYLAGGTAFGPFISRNLTPDPTSGLPANLTFEQFELVIRTGVDLKHVPPHVPSETNDLLQVMPWPVYQDMTDHDLLAVYKYLSAIPHAEAGS